MSGIYIPGMKMPKPGRYEATIIILDESTAEIAISPEENDIGYWKEYPIIPVPEHGDLIDRDETVKTLAHDYAYAAADMVRDEMPTIIPASTVDKEGEG